jgi:type I restriction enzyme S subunit
MAIKPYPKYKDSGIEWIGKIPEHWGKKKLKYEYYFTMGQSPDSNDYLENKDGIPFLQGNGEFGYNHPEPKIWCNTANKYAEEKDILMSVRAPIGEINIANRKYGIGRGLCAIRPKNGINKFIYYFSLCLKDELNSIGTGTTYTAVTTDDIKNIKVIVPPISEQQFIATYLDHKTKEIDDTIAKKQRLIELLEEERKATINEAVTKGLNTNVKMKDSGIEWIGEIPEHWEVKKLKYIAHIVLGKMLTPNDKGGYVLKPYLRAQNLQWLRPDVSNIKEMWFSEDELKIYRVEKNDLLISEGGEIGRTCIWNNELDEVYIQNSVNKVSIINDDSYYYLFLFYSYGHKGHFDAIVNRVSIAHLTKEKLKEVFVLVPPYREQVKISNMIKKTNQKIDNSIQKITDQIELLKEYRQSLIFEAVTGKIDLREEVKVS